MSGSLQPDEMRLAFADIRKIDQVAIDIGLKYKNDRMVGRKRGAEVHIVLSGKGRPDSIATFQAKLKATLGKEVVIDLRTIEKPKETGAKSALTLPKRSESVETQMMDFYGDCFDKACKAWDGNRDITIPIQNAHQQNPLHSAGLPGDSLSILPGALCLKKYPMPGSGF